MPQSQNKHFVDDEEKKDWDGIELNPVSQQWVFKGEAFIVHSPSIFFQGEAMELSSAIVADIIPAIIIATTFLCGRPERGDDAVELQSQEQCQRYAAGIITAIKWHGSWLRPTRHLLESTIAPDLPRIKLFLFHLKRYLWKHKSPRI